jgi:hypothetical protein
MSDNERLFFVVFCYYFGLSNSFFIVLGAALRRVEKVAA